MANIPPRNYNCRNEELPVICRFAAFSFKRDLPDFQSFSPRFDEAYAASFEALINQATEIAEPKSETLQIKVITEKLYKAMDGLKNPIARLSGYVSMISDVAKISSTDFGLTALRKTSNSKDAEGTLKNLKLILTNIAHYQAELTEVGLKDDLVAAFSSAQSAIAEGKQAQYEIESNRKAIVQNNQALFSNLYDQLTEILSTGKILYKDADSAKLTEYTFSKLKSRVRKSTGSNSGEDEDNQAPDASVTK